jgi:hypothetical protein
VTLQSPNLTINPEVVDRRAVQSRMPRKVVRGVREAYARLYKTAQSRLKKIASLVASTLSLLLSIVQIGSVSSMDSDHEAIDGTKDDGGWSAGLFFRNGSGKESFMYLIEPGGALVGLGCVLGTVVFFIVSSDDTCGSI